MESRQLEWASQPESGDLVSSSNNITTSLVTLDMCAFLLFPSFLGPWSLIFLPFSLSLSLFFFFFLFYGSWLLLLTWLPGHFSSISPCYFHYFMIMKCRYSAHAKVSGTYLHKKYLWSSLNLCIPSLHIHKVWFCESSVGPKNLSLYRHPIWIWCRWFFEKHWLRTYVYVL